MPPDSPHDSPSNSMLNLCCFNARGLKSNLHLVHWLLSNLSLDFLAISEHWLHDFDYHLFSNMHHYLPLLPIATPPPCQEDLLICAPRLIRGHYGVALGWHRRVNYLISPTPFISPHRAIGVELSSSLGQFYIVSVYLHTCTNSTDIFRESIDHLAASLLLLPPLPTL